jgi:LPS export ABC transporter permease LptF
MNLRIFDRYIWRQVFTATLTGVAVLSGVMVLGNIYKKLEQLLGDTQLPLGFVIEFMALVVPFSLTFTIPCALLVAVLLVFGRMSADNEMVSLRMTGMPMWRICVPVFLLATLLSGLCFYVNVDLAPWAKARIKHMFFEVATRDPVNLFQAGRVLDRLPGYRIYTSKIKHRGPDREYDTLENLQIIKLSGIRADTFIQAKSAEIISIPGETDFTLQLNQAVIETIAAPETGKPTAIQPMSFSRTAYRFPLSDLKERTDKINASMKPTNDLWQEARTGNDSVTGEPLDKKTLSAAKTEAHKRYSFSLACLTFALIGIPLGITAQRRETTAGFVLGLITTLVYIALIMIADTQNENRSVYPHLLMWLPNVLFISIGSWLFYKMSRR